MIVIVSMFEDIHARAVSWALGVCGETSVLLDMPPFPARARMSQSIDEGEISATLWNSDTSETISVRSSQVSAVWRRRFNDKAFDFTGLHPADLKAAQRECRRFAESLRGQFTSLKTARQFNPMRAVVAVESKLQQLAVAQLTGMRTPATLISNCPDEIRRFFREHDQHMITKPLAPESWYEDDRRFIQQTALITRDNAELLTDETLALCPSIYQEYVKKDYELRITYFNGKMHAARIDTSKDPRAVVDSKGGFFLNTPVTPVQLDPELARQISDFCERTGLAFGCFDVVVDSDGAKTFLEVNEQGQFLWLEQINPEARMLREFVGMLLNVDSETLPDVSLAEFFNSEDQQSRSSREELRNARYASNRETYGIEI